MNYNATADRMDANLAAGRGGKLAVIEDGGARFTYAALCERANRAGNALLSLGVQPEQRVLLLMTDTADFPAVFWGAKYPRWIEFIEALPKTATARSSASSCARND